MNTAQISQQRKLKQVVVQFLNLDHHVGDLEERGIKNIHHGGTQCRRGRRATNFYSENSGTTWLKLDE